MELKDFFFRLPESSIAQEPRKPRDSALLYVMKADGTSIHSVFRKLPSLLEESDLLVVNDTRTIKARLFGKRPTGGKCELLLLRPLETLDRWEAMARPAKRLKTGSSFTIGGARVRITKELEEGLREVEFDGCDVEQLIERSGHVPLPPYIRRKDEKGDRRDYQTVYARQGYSVAAPTAGLHFTGRVLRDLEKKGLEIAKIRLDVGLGTFRPIVAENIDDHRMHSERYFVPEKASEQINRALKSGRRIVAVGTTVVRTLEDQGSRFGGMKPGAYESSIFIKPGYRFTTVSAMITNFHLPGSTLFVLVSAFMGRERMLAAYRDAIDSGFRFYSYGDAMLLFRK
ncbi:MAG TPA: tRNA preQ1(34) S-adenosylmethionine ribosyltransferase-isomerase QueA [Acidobacteriota bacterium]|jgi:S-adenosylmethionine:tRNA ribosyltransferase-isomerase|nr:tRNA preQ1(34) S-adenosylmethionine ribosyltransferase-isomerase QueA [Acidobacteriota bacterium]HQO19258.1 tRNA preQ1(34) S-adenosylmethionine ribosyltransferase-isomerase QueA [Acidobacteriota bacterium]HQQ46070.1 tRNA preQ1(34) S-adenosylmethionine ribosyltransferase-isomerase QueA [Acidobacteriota bacterium]